MPQLFAPGNALAIGIESSLILYLVQQYGFSAGRAPVSTILFAGLAATACTYAMFGANSLGGASPVNAPMQQPMPNAFQDYRRGGGPAPGRDGLKTLSGSNPLTSDGWTGLTASPMQVAIENAVLMGLVEYWSGSIAAADIIIAGLITYGYNMYIQNYIAPWINKVDSYF